MISKHSLSNDKFVQQLDTEIRSMYQLQHKNIARLYDHLEDKEHIYFIMEFCEKNSLQTITRRKQQSESAVKYVIYQILKGLEYIHARRMIHRDLKLENILIDKDEVVKITDFGWSAFIENDKRTTYCGTFYYLAPEFFLNTGYGNKVDIWAMGVLMFELTNGRVPFMGKNDMETQKEIMNGRLKFDCGISTGLREIITRCLNKNPDRRMTVTEILEHEYFSEYRENDHTEGTNPTPDFDYMNYVYESNGNTLKEYVDITTNYKDILYSIDKETYKVKTEIERPLCSLNYDKSQLLPEVREEEEEEDKDPKEPYHLQMVTLGNLWADKYKAYQDLTAYNIMIDSVLKENAFYEERISKVKDNCEKLKAKQNPTGSTLKFRVPEFAEDLDRYHAKYNEYMKALVQLRILQTEEKVYQDVDMQDAAEKIKNIYQNINTHKDIHN